MNTYIYAGNSSLLAIKDNDINSVSSIRNHYLNIDWAWVIEEDGVLKFNGKEYDVKAGDIVLVLYASYKRSDDDREIAIIKSEELITTLSEISNTRKTDTMNVVINVLLALVN